MPSTHVFANSHSSSDRPDDMNDMFFIFLPNWLPNRYSFNSNVAKSGDSLPEIFNKDKLPNVLFGDDDHDTFKSKFCWFIVTFGLLII